jgi:prepilin-type processing-associated H-X9-DG protein
MPYKTPPASSRVESAFSVTELLVAIGIVACLLVLVLSALNVTTESAKSAKCVNNLRQLSAGMLIYAADNGGMLPKVFDYELQTPWMSALSVHGVLPWYWDPGHFKLWHCPSWRPFSADGPAGGAPYLFTYGLVMPWDGDFERRLSKLTGDTPLLADSIGENDNATPGWSNLQHYYVVASVPTNTHRLHLRHRGKVTIAFVGGHCRSVTRDELKDMTVNDIPITNWSERKSP